MPPAKRGLTVVGIGASAGGLEALQLFFETVPLDSGLAFVVVQHLDPTHKGIMPELLQRATAMPVVQIRDRLKVRPDHVYVIPPNRDLSILRGVLHLREPTAPRGLHLPIDIFFRSLADDRKDQSIGVILSGMGSDGTLGLRAIKEKAGAAFVQDPDTAKFDGMPRSAIDAGLADVAAPAQELPGKILAYLRHLPPLAVRLDVVARTGKDQSGLEKIVQVLRAHVGHDFSQYKKGTLYRRIERRMGLHQLRQITDYARYLRENPQEVQLLFKELLIGVTGFFRDPEVWERLKKETIPALLAAHPEGATLRAWVPGCSTGEEAYSLAIVFREALAKVKAAADYRLQVFATDVDVEAIERARAGAYPPNIAADVGEARLRRFFVREERGYRVASEIRETVVFARQNLLRDPPFTKLDLISCRNLLIYLEAELQKKLLPLFHYSLKPDGILVLGNAETIGPATDLFAPLPGKARIYRRREAVLAPERIEIPSAFSGHGTEAQALAPAPPVANFEAQADRLLLARYCPAAVLTSAEGDILYISGKTGKYLEPAAGKANLNLFAMAREGLAGALNAAFPRAVRKRATVALKAVPVRTNGGSRDSRAATHGTYGTRYVDITVQPLAEPAALRGMVLVVFADVAAPHIGKAKGKTARGGTNSGQPAALAEELRQAREELRRSRDELQSTQEEMQSSQEELKSANEELQSTNEELQSTNEELTTSREEMQSLNEELQTVNQELQAKVDELTRSGDDMKNLLDATDIPTLFLDAELRVRRFTSHTAGIINLIPGDAGRPITDLATELDYPELAEDAREVLRTLVPSERQVATRDGRWLTVRTMPYLAQDRRIDGVVITFVDVSVTKAQEAITTLRDALEVLQGRFDDQSAELDAARAQENALRQAQAILEQHLAAQQTELEQARAGRQAVKRKKP